MTRRGRGVDLLARRADGRGAHAGLLRLDEHRVGVADLGRRLADVEHARDVGAVAVHRAAEVAQHDVAVGDRARRGRLVVRAGGVARRRRRSRSSPARGPAASMRSTSSRCTSSSVRPANGTRSRISAAIASTACAARAQRGDLVGVLHHADRADDVGRARRTSHDGSARWRSSTNRAHVWSPIATRARRAPDEPATIAIGSSVSSHGTISNSSGCGDDARRLEPGHDERRVAVARQHEHREPLERHRLVAGEVRQVGADREQQHVDAELVHARPRTRDAVGVRGTSRVDPGQAVDARRVLRLPVLGEPVVALALAPSRGAGRGRRRDP